MEQKNTFLKIMSTILLFGGIVYLIIAAVALALGEFEKFQSDPKGTLLIIAGILMLIAGIFVIIAGKLGKSACKNPAKAKACVVFGSIMIIPSVIAFIFSIIAINYLAGVGGVSIHAMNYVSAILSLILGIIIPVLYILAAKMVKPAA